MENKPSEGDLAKRILDTDTFVSYLVGYRSSVIATRLSDWTRHPDLHSRVNPDKPRIKVSLESVVWQDIPQSIQQVMLFQYPSASVDEEKKIEIALDIPDGRLLLRLISPSIINGFRADTPDGKYRSYDKYGKIVVPDNGLALLLKSTKLGHKGDWIISRRPANSFEVRFVDGGMAEKEYGEVSEKKLMKAMAKMSGKPVEKEEVFTRPATLEELQNIVAILERGKATAKWRESLAH